MQRTLSIIKYHKIGACRDPPEQTSGLLYHTLQGCHRADLLDVPGAGVEEVHTRAPVRMYLCVDLHAFRAVPSMVEHTGAMSAMRGSNNKRFHVTADFPMEVAFPAADTVAVGNLTMLNNGDGFGDGTGTFGHTVDPPRARPVRTRSMGVVRNRVDRRAGPAGAARDRVDRRAGPAGLARDRVDGRAGPAGLARDRVGWRARPWELARGRLAGDIARYRGRGRSGVPEGGFSR